MQVTIEMTIKGHEKKEIICIQRELFAPETVGLSLEEAKKLTFGIQKKLVEHQVKEYISKNQTCSCCGKMFAIKGHNTLVYRTLFGKISLKGPRFRSCSCQNKKSSFSPLPQVLIKRASPELMYLESKWASLMSYEMTARF